MTRGYLIDTSIWIDVEQGRIGPADVAAITEDAPVFLSPITLAELKLGVEVCTEPAVKQQRQVTLRRMLRKPIVQIDGDTSQVFGEIAAAVLQQGVSHPPRPGSVARRPGHTARLEIPYAQ